MRQAVRCFLGIDIGSVSLSYVLLDHNKQICKCNYGFHQGNISRCLKRELKKVDLSRVWQVAYNLKSSDFFLSGIGVNDQIALIEGVRHQQENVGSVFTIGGETFGLILFGKDGQYQKYISNSSCAAGTGGFLDQQAERLGLSGSAELSQLAGTFQGEPPKIATRCAVFAKTDLIHCQQEGYSIEAISAGLCKGLAHNIGDTLIKGAALRGPVVVVGGVSKNPTVMRYLSELIGCSIVIPQHAVLSGALGCALIAHSRTPTTAQRQGFSMKTLLKEQNQAKQYFFPPLSSEQSVYPNFSNHTRYVARNVEVDLYNLPEQKGRIPAYLGIDIGSTSTKAVVTEANQARRVVLGLYTRTKGQPIAATQALLRVLRDIENEHEIQFEFFGTGTTGSGRKFIQSVVNADVAIDEITAHARAAYALNENVDTIIEIGGQDSKFTVMKNGQVTFSTMNYVCAAGTGSFIEEQANRLNVPLKEYSERAMGAASPLTSDRCTVFMERDLNHFLSQGYSSDELLAAILHSVRDNYLSKVAHLNKIGNALCFQGATAKNKALVAAFEQKLQKPIFVSRYCHLTGALGVCLLLQEKSLSGSQFRGLDFYKESPNVTEEICELCNNHCKLKRIHLAGDSVLWGFMCGRDETSTSRVSANQSGFDMLNNRRKVFRASRRSVVAAVSQNEKQQRSILEEIKLFDGAPSTERFNTGLELGLLNLRHKLFAVGHNGSKAAKENKQITIGIPGTLYMHEFLPFWKVFFNELGYKVKVAPTQDTLLEKGKEIAGAEFCVPMTYWHGQVQTLSLETDYLFMPHMFQVGQGESSKFFCYYSNYAAALLKDSGALNLESRCLSPIIDFSKPVVHNVHQLYTSLPPDLKFAQTPAQIGDAYIRAWNWFTVRKQKLVEIFQQHHTKATKFSVVLLGRPYLVLDPAMNKNIPQKFNGLGVKTFFQDMLPQADVGPDSPAREFIDGNHWKYGADVLRAAEYVGKTPGLYPVFLSAFKCSPDSFVLTYFKEIMDNHQKPYLILQIDEHGSDGGYATRVEAGVEAFCNHFQRNVETKVGRAAPRQSMSILPSKQQTILIPNYDSLGCYLICAAFERAGYRARLIEETPETVVSSLRLNDGQCLPVSTIVQGAVETIQKYKLKPEDTAIFGIVDTQIACNIPQYPLMIKKLLEQRGAGFEKVQVCTPELDISAFPLKALYDAYCAFLLGGLVKKIGCRRRPYEMGAGETDRLIEQARHRLYHCIANGEPKEQVFEEIVNGFSKIPVSSNLDTRPKVAIIGDVYVRDNDTFNQQLTSSLENYGAEVVTVPYNYVFRLATQRHTNFLWKNGHYGASVRDKLLLELLKKFEERFYRIAENLLGEACPTFDDSIFEQLDKYNLSLNHIGETATNLLKIFSLLQHYPDISLFIHINPIFCCPGLVSEALFKTVEKDIGIPIVSLIYDGTNTNKNELLAPYLHYFLHPATLSENDSQNPF